MSGCLLASCLIVLFQLIGCLQGYALSQPDEPRPIYSLEDEMDNFQMENNPQKSRHKLIGFLRLQNSYPSSTRDSEEFIEAAKRYKPMSGASQENYRKYLSQARKVPALSNPLQGLKRRDGPTLSIVSPLEVLRQQLFLATHQRAQQKQAEQIRYNQELLDRAGKRSVDPEDDEPRRLNKRESVSYTV